MEIRTDLAVESYENGGKTLIDGVKVEENENVTVVSVLNNNGAAALGKPIGKYITYCADTSLDDTQIFDGRLDDLSKILSSLLPSGVNSVLVAGLGNSDITADALGPKAVNYVLATRHIINDLSENNDYFSQFFNVSSISTGVLGDTGIESAEIIKGVVNQINPDCVIVVDATFRLHLLPAWVLPFSFRMSALLPVRVSEITDMKYQSKPWVFLLFQSVYPLLYQLP